MRRVEMKEFSDTESLSYIYLKNREKVWKENKEKNHKMNRKDKMNYSILTIYCNY